MKYKHHDDDSICEKLKVADGGAIFRRSGGSGDYKYIGVITFFSDKQIAENLERKK